jgi:hypothetical protein
MSVEEEPEPQPNVAAKYAMWSIISHISFYLILFSMVGRIDIPYPLSRYIIMGLFVLPSGVGCIFSFMALIKAGAQDTSTKKRYVILVVFSLIHAFALLTILSIIDLLSNVNISSMS